MERTKRREYSEELRAKVLDAVQKTGVCATAKEYNVPAGTVSRWATAAGVKRETSAERPVAPEAVSSDLALPGPPTGPPETQVDPPPLVTASIPPVRDDLERPAPMLGPQVAKVYTPSQKAAILEGAAKGGPTAAAKKHNVSRFSIRDWKLRVHKAAAGKGPSPTSGPSPLDIVARRDAEILEEYKTHPGLGPSQIRNQLRRRNIRVSTNTARLVMESAGYRPPKVQRQKHDRRYEAVRPNHLWLIIRERQAGPFRLEILALAAVSATG